MLTPGIFSFVFVKITKMMGEKKIEDLSGDFG